MRLPTRRVRTAPDRLDVVTWNAKVGRRPAEVALDVAQLLKDRPDVAALQEAGGYVKALREALRGDYHVIAAHGWAEAGNSAFLVRRDVPVTRWSTIRLRVGWVGPKAFRRHPGRTFPVLNLGREWRIVNVHRTPGGPTGGVMTQGRNKPSWNAEHVALGRLADRKGSHRRALVMVGDQNCESDDRHPMGVPAFADDHGMRIVRTGAKVDWAIVRGCRGDGNRGSNLGSDHPTIRYTLTRKD